MKVILYRASGTRNISPFFRVQAFLDRFRGSQNGGYDPFYRAIYRTALSRTSPTEQFLAPPHLWRRAFRRLEPALQPRVWLTARKWYGGLCHKLGGLAKVGTAIVS